MSKSYTPHFLINQANSLLQNFPYIEVFYERSFDNIQNFMSNGPRPNPSDWACIQGEESCLGDKSQPENP